MFGVTVQSRKPRNPGDYLNLLPDTTATLDVGGVVMTVTNTRTTRVYIKWRI
jgi:hypothetical protein